MWVRNQRAFRSILNARAPHVHRVAPYDGRRRENRRQLEPCAYGLPGCSGKLHHDCEIGSCKTCCRALGGQNCPAKGHRLGRVRVARSPSPDLADRLVPYGVVEIRLAFINIVRRSPQACLGTDLRYLTQGVEKSTIAVVAAQYFEPAQIVEDKLAELAYGNVAPGTLEILDPATAAWRSIAHTGRLPLPKDVATLLLRARATLNAFPPIYTSDFARGIESWARLRIASPDLTPQAAFAKAFPLFEWSRDEFDDAITAWEMVPFHRQQQLVAAGATDAGRWTRLIREAKRTGFQGRRDAAAPRNDAVIVIDD